MFETHVEENELNTRILYNIYQQMLKLLNGQELNGKNKWMKYNVTN